MPPIFVCVEWQWLDTASCSLTPPSIPHASPRQEKRRAAETAHPKTSAMLYTKRAIFSSVFCAILISQLNDDLAIGDLDIFDAG